MTIIVAYPQGDNRFGNPMVLAKQSRQNIPIVIPLETNVTSNYIDGGGVGDKNQLNDVLTAGKPGTNIAGTAGGMADLVEGGGKGGGQEGPEPNLGVSEEHYFYNLSIGGLGSEAAERLETIKNQYIVLLDSTIVAASYEANNNDTLNDVDAQKMGVKAMAAEAVQQGAQVTRVYENLSGYTVRAPPDDPLFIDRLRNDPRVALVEKDQIVFAMSQSLPTGINRIDADLSNVRSGDGKGTVDVDVAVLDSGIDLKHPDLNVYRSKTFVSGTSSAQDDNGHGTLVSGIIGAKDDNSGVVGVVPGARLWGIKVLDKSGNGLISNIISGIDYIVQYAKEIDAANLSFGCECSSFALDSAINKAVSAGITFGVAAGNSGKNANTFAPANNPNVIAVSAVTDSDGKCGAAGPNTGFGADDRLASFSNYGSTITIAAPGVEVLTTSMNGGYAKMSGTSASAPHVTGAAALYKAANPSASPAQVKSGLISNAVKSSSGTCDGNGFGYFTGDKDTYREPLLYLKGMGPTSNGDGGGNENPAPVPNNPPTADSKSISTNVNTAVDITLSGSDPENDPISFSVVDLPKNGQLSSISGSTVRYTPNNAFTGGDSFTYVSRDDKGTISTSKATVSITVGQIAACGALGPASVSASGDDGNIPSNVLDNNLNTRWSNLGQGSWIQLDLGEKKTICSVDIAWYRGDVRQNNFIISVSNDGASFTQKHSGISSGTTTLPEKYTLPAGTEGRYVRITVNGNTESEWASITETAIFGSGHGGGPGNLGPIIHKAQSVPGSNTWIPYKSLGGNIKSDPFVIRNTDGTLQVFAVSATNGELLYKKQSAPGSNTWIPYKSLGGSIQSDPFVIRNPDGTLQVFAVSATNGELLYKKQSAPGSNTWMSYRSIGGNIKANPAVAINTDGTLQVFAVSATNGELLYKKQSAPGSNTWLVYRSLGGNIQSDPFVIRNPDGTLQVFAVSATNGEILYKKQSSPGSNTWMSYRSLGGNIRANPAVAINTDGTLQVFAVSATNGELLYKKQSAPGSNTWIPYKSLGGNIQSDPEIGYKNDGTLVAFVDGVG